MIENLLSERRIVTIHSGHHHSRPGWIQLDCPFCGSGSHKYHLGFNLSSGYFHCWKCGGHSVFDTLIALGVERATSYRAAKNRLESYSSSQKEEVRGDLREPGGRTSLLPVHRRYLRKRGFDPDHLVAHWQLEGIGMAHPPILSWRIYIPILWKGRRVSWTSRAIGNVSQRYYSASADQEEINHKHLVYGMDFCRSSIVIVEGPADVWAIGPGAGALFGTAFTPAQIRKLIDIPYRYICFDSSPDAQREATKLAEALSVFPGVTENLLLDAKDPGEASSKELNSIRRHAKLSPR